MRSSRLFCISVTAVLSVVLTGCEGGGPGTETSKPQPTRTSYKPPVRPTVELYKPATIYPTYPTFTEDEQKADFERMVDAELALLAFGLSFDMKKNPMRWDTQFLNEYLKEFSAPADKEVLGPLENFIKAKEDFFKKYSGSYFLKKKDGTKDGYELKEEFKERYEAKANLCKRLIEELKKTGDLKANTDDWNA